MKPIIPSLPNLPSPPSGPGDLMRWAGQMQRAAQELYRQLANRVEELILVGTLAERPAANDTRRYYFTPGETTTDPPTGTLYFDDGTWVPVGGAVSSPFSLTVKEVDGVPTVVGVNVIRFDQDDGYSVTDDGAGQVTLGMTHPAVPDELVVREVDEDPTVDPTSVLEFDQDDGFVVSDQGSGVARVNLTLPAIPDALTVREVDLSPTVTPVSILEFAQADGFVVSDQGSGVARVNITVPPPEPSCPPEPEVPTGDVDGTNRDFFLSQAPPCGGMLFVDVAFQVPGCHYDFDPDDETHIIFTRGNAPRSGACPYWIYL